MTENKPECFGQRVTDEEECDNCQFIEDCSYITLKQMFGEKIQIVH